MDAVKHIKGYELRERIGTGGFGAVYKAHQSTVGREVAIKIILPGLANQPDFIRRFETEAQLVARLEHPHITPLYDYWRDPDGAYLVMRWLRGGSLHDALQNGPFELRAAVLLLDQVAGALSLAHRSGVIHRDIKPGNILLDEDGNAYLTDFGIAKDLNLAANGTKQDAIVGSLDYISPEQARSEPVTPRTDIYSLGVTLYEIIVGEHPFPNLSSVERLYKHINDPLPEIANLEDAVSDAVNRVVQKATAKNPEGRYADALAFAADFREAVGMNRTPTNVEELLTQREHEILHLIIAGMSNKEIAQQLTVTVGTVKWYVNQIYGKLGVRSRVQAMVRARELNLLGSTIETATAPHIPTEDFTPENPYKGLRAFQSADHADFFGREKITARLVQRMGEDGDSARFLAVVGPSGSGKSSLVKAGLIPALWRGELPGSEKWFVVEMLPGARPLDELEIALIKVAAQQAGSLREQLDRNENGLVRVAQLILPNDGSDLLLVIDQFEEVFTLVESEHERQRFLDLLYAAICAPRSRVRVVITLRADFYDRPLHYPKFGELVRTRLETIMPLSAEELERAITRPAARVGLSFEAGLAASIVADVNYQPGALPLLQYALTELFERRHGHLLTREAYEAIGKTVGALAKRAEEVYLSLDAAGQEAARQMILRLVTLGEGTEDTRRRTARSELLAIAPDTDLMDEVIDTFASYRLLALDNDPGTRTPTVEVAHEALLREWERLRMWLEQSRDDIRLQRQIGALAVEWREAKQNASYLARGSRLEQFAKWASDTPLALTPAERAFLDASAAQHERETNAELERQAREKGLERRSVLFLRVLVGVLLVATLGAFGLTGVAVNRGNAAEASASYASSIALASGAKTALLSNNPDQAIALAVAANTATDNPPAFAQSVLYEAAFVPATQRAFTDQATAEGLVVSPDGRRALSWGTVNSFVYWDLETGQTLAQLNPAFMAFNEDQLSEISWNELLRLRFAPSGESAYAMVPSADMTSGNLIEFDVMTGVEIRRFEQPENGFPKPLYAIALSPDGHMIVAGTGGIEGEDGVIQSPIYVWDVPTGRLIQQFAERLADPIDAPSTLNFSPDGQKVLVGYYSGLVGLWDVTTGAPIRRFEGVTDFIRGVYYTTTGIVATHYEFDQYTGSVTLWDEASGEILHQQQWDSPVPASDLAPDGRALAISFVAPYIIHFDVQTWQPTQELYGHGGSIWNVHFMPDGRRLLSSSPGDTVRLWNLENEAEVVRMDGLTSFLADMRISPDGRTMLSQEFNGPLALWDLETGEMIRSLGQTQSFFRSVAFSPDGRTIVSGTSTESQLCPGPGSDLTLTDVSTGEVVWQSHKAGGYVNSGITFARDGSQILSVDWWCENNVTVWDAATGAQITQWLGHQAPIWAISASADGKWIATGSDDKTAILWDASTGTIVDTPLPHDAGVVSVAFSPDSTMLLTATQDGLLHLWDIASREEIQLTGHTARVAYMQFSPDGRYIVSGGTDSNVFVWDVSVGEAVRAFHFPLISPLGSVVAFSPDSQSIFLTDDTNTIRQIDLMLEPGELLNWVNANRYVPELTCAQRELYQLEPLCAADGAAGAV